MTDETNVNAQDSSQNGDTSGNDGGSTSQKTQTFTKSDVEKAVSDALAKAGRTAKDIEKREAEINKRLAAFDDWQKRQEEAEEEAVRGDAGKMADLQAKRKSREEARRIAEEKAALEREKAEHAEKLTRAEQLEQKISVLEAAQKHGLDATVLKEKCEKFGFKTEQQINDFAAELASSAGNRGNLHIDRSETRGNTGEPTADQLEKMTPEKYAEWASKRYK